MQPIKAAFQSIDDGISSSSRFNVVSTCHFARVTNRDWPQAVLVPELYTAVAFAISERLEEVLQLSGRAMETLACLDIFDLNDPGASPADRVDGVHAKPAVANEP